MPPTPNPSDSQNNNNNNKFDLKDLCKPIEVAAQYSSLSDDERCKWVLSVILMSQWFRNYKRYERYVRNELVADIEWSSYPTKEELMRVWDFDEDDAENLYNPFQDEDFNRSLDNRLGKLIYEERYIDPEEMMFDKTRYSKTNNVEVNSEVKVNQSDDGVWTGAKFNIDVDKERKQILDLVKQYRKKNEKRKQMFEKIKTEE